MQANIVGSGDNRSNTNIIPQQRFAIRIRIAAADLNFAKTSIDPDLIAAHRSD